jgi:monoamine oxidase
MFQTPTEGTDLQLIDGTATELLSEPGYASVVQTLDELATIVPSEEPWATPGGETLDQMSVDDWLERNVPDVTVQMSARKVLEGLMTVPATDMSVLTVLHAARTSGTLAAALGIDGGAQELRLMGGLHGLARHLADDLGDGVALSTAARGVRHFGDRVVVSTVSAEVGAARCIVAVPPSGWTRIEFDPPLPAQHAQLAESMPLGSVIKLQLIYERPFWRDAERSGLVIDASGPFSFMVDNSSPDRPEGVLVTFLSAGTADKWSDRALGPGAQMQRQRALIDHVCAAFGPSGSTPIGYLDRDWRAAPWVGGGYSGVMRPGGWFRAGAALRAPVGPIHWASAESATEWNGYVEGALDAGSRAATEVLSEL